MKTFEVYKHPTIGMEAVKIGFSWPAFFFGFWWNLFKKLWAGALIYFVLFMILNVFATAAEEVGQMGMAFFVYLLMIGLAIIWGVNGNEWRKKNLTKRGFTHKGNVEAGSPDAAIASIIET